MSVAFRRESDDEHLEPRFELPIPAGANLVTTRGLRLLRERVAALEAAVAAAPDEDARKAAARELRYWHTRLATAEPMPPPAGDEVQFGTRVRFRVGGRERTLTITGHDEADAAAGRIAFNAPLARALIGGLAGERVAFGGTDDAIEILEVSAADDDHPEA